MDNVVLEAKNISKWFGNVVALNNVSLQISNKEILAIVGENGAGKSTICKIITGLYQQNEGEVFFLGNPVNFKSTKESIAAGIAMVYQERNLVPLLTGAQNIVMGNEKTKGFFLDEKSALAEAKKIQAMLNTNVPLDITVENLGAGEQQLLEIMRAIYRNPRLLILDEPTASLGEGEIQPFLKFISELVQRIDISIIYISHKLEEIQQVADHVIVLTDGTKKLDKSIKETSIDECIAAMIRSAELAPINVPKKIYKDNDILLECKTGYYDNAVHNLNTTVYRGEVVGCYGLVGSGRTEWAEYLYGLKKAEKREYKFCGEIITKCTPGEMIKRGMILTPEKRSDGIFREFSLEENIGLLYYGSTLSSKLGVVDKKTTTEFGKFVLKKNNVKCSGSKQLMKELSGGNIQKTVIGRSVESESCKLLIVDEPTNGMDVGAKHEVYIQLRRLAEEENMGVIFISSELSELLGICDRIYIFANGNIVDMFMRSEFDKTKILEAAILGRAVT